MKKTILIQLAATLLAASLSARTKESAVPPLPSDIPSTAQRYTVNIMGNRAGQQAVWSAADGTLHIFFQFNDRGRGPKISTILKLDDKGIPTSESVTGNDYLKSAVNETYSLDGSTARWKNDAEQGDKKLTAPGMYASINGAPAELAIMVHAARANHGRIAVLPEGESQVEAVATRNLENSGKQQQVSLYAITGLDFSPSYIWLDDHDNFFATVNPWATIILEGWEKNANTLQQVQDDIVHAHSAELAAKFAHLAPHGLAFTHANLFDAESAKVLKDQTVVVSGNRIQAVGPAAEIRTPPDAQVIDANGKTLLPGLWDMHTHVSDNDGLLNLAAGVTSVRDLANDTDSLLARRKRIDEGKEIGTRIVIVGIIDGPGPYQGPTKVLVATEQEARAAVDNYKRLGYVQIKIYSSVKPELVPAIIDEAHRNGLRVSGHIPAEMTAAQCVQLGYDEVQHANFLMLNFWPDVKNTNTPSRFTEVAKRGADLDLKTPEVQSFIKLLQDHHTDLDVTLSVFEDMFTEPAGKMPRGFNAVAHRLPPQVRRGLLSSGLTPPAGLEQRYRESFTRMMEFVGLLYRSGIPIESGTDSLAGFSLHRELELHVQAGIPPERVLQDATLGAARIMSLDRDLGSVTAGKLADLALVDGDPTVNISDIRKTALVVKDGVLYRPEELYGALGVTP